MNSSRTLWVLLLIMLIGVLLFIGVLALREYFHKTDARKLAGICAPMHRVRDTGNGTVNVDALSKSEKDIAYDKPKVPPVVSPVPVLAIWMLVLVFCRNNLTGKRLVRWGTLNLLAFVVVGMSYVFSKLVVHFSSNLQRLCGAF